MRKQLSLMMCLLFVLALTAACIDNGDNTPIEVESKEGLKIKI